MSQDNTQGQSACLSKLKEQTDNAGKHLPPSQAEWPKKDKKGKEARNACLIKLVTTPTLLREGAQVRSIPKY